jgi:hypothetical protein
MSSELGTWPAAVSLVMHLSTLFLASLALSASAQVHQAKLEISSYPLVFTDIEINGVKAKAMIDTGAFMPFQVSGTLAKRLELKLQPTGMKMSRLNGATLELMRGRVGSLSIGNYTARDVDVNVAEGNIESVSKQVNTPYDVIIGWGFLSKYYLTLDYRHKKLGFAEQEPHAAPGSAVPFRTFHGAPLFDATVDGKPTVVLFDTGAPTCNLDLPSTKGDPSHLESHQLQASQLNLKLDFRPRNLEPIKKGLGAGAVAGNNLISLYLINIDPKKGQISFAKT